jgi:hypothetical protein
MSAQLHEKPVNIHPAMASRIEMWSLDRLIPYARNARTHSDAQVAQIAASMLEFGVNNPLLVDSRGGLVAGHGRLLAARKLGLERLPVVVLDHLTENQRRAYIFADNRLAELAGWDTEMLALEQSELEGEFDFSDMGFDEEEVRKLLGSPETDAAADTSPDDDGAEDEEDEPVPDAPAHPVTRTGDVWLLGRHRLICGDSAKAEAVRQLMGGEKAALCFSSPPYANQRMYTTGGIGDWDTLMRGVYGNLAHAMEDDGGQVLVNLGLVHRENEFLPYWDGWIEWMRTQGWRRFGWYVWHNGWGLPGDWNGRLAPCFEFIFHFNKVARRPNKIEPCRYAGSMSHLDKNGSGHGMRNPDGSVGKWTHAGQPVQDFKIPDAVIHPKLR